jgi:isoquinoline 1-oxidoreductase subunit beta
MYMKPFSSEASTVNARLSRRAFLRTGVAAGGGLLISINTPLFHADYAAAADTSTTDFAPGAFIRIYKTGQVTAIIPSVEIGQGVHTSMPMLIAEELELDPSHIRVEHAPPDDKLYANPKLGFQATGGSTSIAAFYEPFRQAGATARTILVAAAGATWASTRPPAGPRTGPLFMIRASGASPMAISRPRRPRSRCRRKSR